MATTSNTTNRRPDSLSEASSSKYTIGNLCYPENVGVDDDVQHFVMFYINIRESSKFAKNNKNRIIGEVNNASQNRTDQTRNIDASGTISSDTARTGVLGATPVLGSYFVGKKIAGKAAGGVLAAAALYGNTAAGAGTGSENIFHIEKTQRLSDVITLAVQNRPSVSYGVEWQQTEFGSLMGVLAGSSSVSDTAATSQHMASDIARRMMEVAATIPGALNTNNRVQNMLESGTKRVANPFREVLFKSVGFRKFEFTYKFMPKSESESKQVWDITQTFKYHMHPELVASGLYYIYPSDFDIVYYYKGKENKWLNKISTCALTDMRVDYGGDNNWSTFGNGAPTEINMTLTFTELESLTKERIWEGY